MCTPKVDVSAKGSQVYAPAAVTGMKAANNTSNFENRATINEMLPAMWKDNSDQIQGITVNTILTWNDATKTLEITKTNVTEGITQWTNTQWGSTSVPVVVTLADGYKADTTDANWNNECIIWVDLAATGSTNYPIALSNGNTIYVTVTVK